jgi:hypothetical protein
MQPPNRPERAQVPGLSIPPVSAATTRAKLPWRLSHVPPIMAARQRRWRPAEEINHDVHGGVLTIFSPIRIGGYRPCRCTTPPGAAASRLRMTPHGGTR